MAAILLPAARSASEGTLPDGMAGASPAAAGLAGGTSGMDVEVDVYSGQPNPHFHLEAPMADELMRRIARLPPAPSGAAPRNGLGYRGLRISASDTEPVSEIIVSDGVVVVRGRDGTERFLSDPDRELERWLIENGTATLNPDEVSVIRQDLAR